MTEAYINKILVPYVASVREKTKVNIPALVIFDRFKGQRTPRILSLLSSNNFLVAVVPGNCTDRLQPLDVSVNKFAKDFLRQKFQQWYADKISESLRNGETAPVVNSH